MNWLLIIIAIFLACNIVAGYKKGFLRTIYYMGQWVLVTFFVSWATPYVTQVLVENTPIESVVEQRCNEWLQTGIQNQQMQIGGVEAGNVDVQNVLDTLGVHLPSSVGNKVFDTSQLAGQILDQSGVCSVVTKNLSDMIIKGLAYVIVFVLTGIIFRSIGRLLRIVNYIPILNGINRTLGLLAGAAEGLLVVWLFMGVVAFFGTTEFGTYIVPYIYEAPVLAWLYENNLILNLILIFM